MYYSYKINYKHVELVLSQNISLLNSRCAVWAPVSDSLQVNSSDQGETRLVGRFVKQCREDWGRIRPKGFSSKDFNLRETVKGPIGEQR